VPHILKVLENLAKALSTFTSATFRSPLRIQATLPMALGPVVQLEVTGGHCCRNVAASMSQGGALDAVMSAQTVLPGAGCPNRGGSGSDEPMMAALIALNAHLLLYERGCEPVKDAA